MWAFQHKLNRFKRLQILKLSCCRSLITLTCIDLFHGNNNINLWAHLIDIFFNRVIYMTIFCAFAWARLKNFLGFFITCFMVSSFFIKVYHTIHRKEQLKANIAYWACLHKHNNVDDFGCLLTKSHSGSTTIFGPDNFVCVSGDPSCPSSGITENLPLCRNGDPPGYLWRQETTSLKF